MARQADEGRIAPHAQAATNGIENTTRQASHELADAGSVIPFWMAGYSAKWTGFVNTCFPHVQAAASGEATRLGAHTIDKGVLTFNTALIVWPFLMSSIASFISAKS